MKILAIKRLNDYDETILTERRALFEITYHNNFSRNLSHIIRNINVCTDNPRYSRS